MASDRQRGKNAAVGTFDVQWSSDDLRRTQPTFRTSMTFVGSVPYARFETLNPRKPRKWFFGPKGDNDSPGLGRLIV